MNIQYPPVLAYPETDEFVPSVVYWSSGTLFLVHLQGDGPVLGDTVEGLSAEKAILLLTSQPQDPYDLIIAGKRMVEAKDHGA